MIYCYCHMFTGAGRNTGPVNRQTKYKSLKTGVFINTLLFHDSFSKNRRRACQALHARRRFGIVLYEGVESVKIVPGTTCRREEEDPVKNGCLSDEF